LPGVAYSAIGQQDVAASALQNALVAAGIANHGTVMAPHLMAQITSSAGNVVSTYKPNPWQVAATPATTAKIIPLMQQVVTNGTASGSASRLVTGGGQDRNGPGAFNGQKPPTTG